MAEKWIKVASESDLRVGMVVEIRGHTKCGGNHRMMLLSVRRGTNHVCAVHRVPGRCPSAWDTTCRPCTADLHNSWCLSAVSGSGRLYRLDDGVDEQEQQREGRDLYAPRPRVAAAGRFADFQRLLDEAEKKRERAR